MESTMESATTTPGAGRPKALDATTMAEAFQTTAQQYADRPAIRTKGDEQSYTWGEYAQKVEELARGLAALGLERGQAIGSMLTNRPEFHFFDTAAMHLGATPFSAYNTYTVDQVTYLIQDSEAKVMVTEKAFLDTVLAVRDADNAAGDRDRGRRRRRERHADHGRRDRRRRRRLRLRGGLEGRRARRHADADLHVGHHRARPRACS